MLKKKKTALIVALFLLGGVILLYPTVSNLVNRLNGSYAMEQLRRELVDVDTNRQRQLAETYNSQLLSGEPEGYEEILNLSNGIMGTICIPKIDVDLPIYHGTGEEELTKGVGHLPSSAFPISGEGNHAVLTGHTGLPSAKLFTDLTELMEGDIFEIHILKEKLTYRVDQIKVVLPSEGQDLAAVPGKDYCTLVTCTPYGINSHRLLVRGIRVTEPEDAAVIAQAEEGNGVSLWIIPAAGLLAVLLIVLLRKKKNEK